MHEALVSSVQPIHLSLFEIFRDGYCISYYAVQKAQNNLMSNKETRDIVA